MLGINFDDADGAPNQFLEASSLACTARKEVKIIDDIPCELSVMQACLGVCKVIPMLRAAGLYVGRSALHEHDVQMQTSLSDMLGCEIPTESMTQASCGVRNGGLGMRRATDLALPAFIASRSESRSAVTKLIHELFNDDIGDVCIRRFDDGLQDAIGKLKDQLSPGLASEVDTCLIEAREGQQRNDRFRPVARGDHLIAPAACVDSEEIDTLQGALSAIVDRDVFNKLCTIYSEHSSQYDVNRLTELCDESTSHDWVCCINSVHGPVIEPDLYLIALKLRIGAPFFSRPFECPKCGTKDMDCNGFHALCCAKGEFLK